MFRSAVRHPGDCGPALAGAMLACFAMLGLPERASAAPANDASLIEIHLSKAKESGPLFVERFDGEALNPDLWQIINGDSGIQVEVQGGELRIHGRTAPDRPTGYNHVGLFGRIFRESDVVGIARIRAVKGFDPEKAVGTAGPSDRLCHVHLCGAVPDYNSTVCFGADHGRYGWTFLVRDWERMAIRGKTLPPFGKEAGQFSTVRVEHFKGQSQGFVLRNGKWEQVGETVPVAHGGGRLEVKITMDPRDHEADMRVADCWMYLHPRVAPARFIITNDWARSIPRLGEYRDKRLRLEVREAKSGALLGAADLENATGEFPVTLDDKSMYPMAAKIAILHEGKAIAQAEITNKDFEGLYPGDVYRIIEQDRVAQPSGGGQSRGRR